MEIALYEWEEMMYNMKHIKMGVYGVKCMKCGRDVESGQVFCPQCLKSMQEYPVNPNVTVRLPRRSDPAQTRKQPRRRQMTEEEQIRLLKKRMRILLWVLAAAVAVIVALSIPAVQYFLEETISSLPGQNYSVAGG